MESREYVYSDWHCLKRGGKRHPRLLNVNEIDYAAVAKFLEFSVESRRRELTFSRSSKEPLKLGYCHIEGNEIDDQNLLQGILRAAQKVTTKIKSELGKINALNETNSETDWKISCFRLRMFDPCRKLVQLKIRNVLHRKADRSSKYVEIHVVKKIYVDFGYSNASYQFQVRRRDGHIAREEVSRRLQARTANFFSRTSLAIELKLRIKRFWPQGRAKRRK